MGYCRMGLNFMIGFQQKGGIMACNTVVVVEICDLDWLQDVYFPCSVASKLMFLS